MKESVWIAALMYNGMLNDSFIPDGVLAQLRLYEGQIEDALKHMEELADANYREEVALLCTIPGVSHISAICVIAEIGTDMSQFGSSARLSGWAGLRPRNDESAGKYKSTAITKGDKHLKAMLVQCAWGAVCAKQYNKLCLQASQAGVSAEKLTEISQS